jgi:hypothetical protein
MTSLLIVYNTLIIPQLGVPPKRIKNAFFHQAKYTTRHGKNKGLKIKADA